MGRWRWYRTRRSGDLLQEERRTAASEILAVTDRLPSLEDLEAAVPTVNALATPQRRSRLLRARFRRRERLRRWRHVLLLTLLAPVLVVGTGILAPDMLATYSRWPGPLVAAVLLLIYAAAVWSAVRAARRRPP